MVDAPIKKPIEGSCEQLNGPEGSSEKRTDSKQSSKETCYAPSDFSSTSGDSEHVGNEGSEGVLSTSQIEEMPPLMDLHRLQTDEEAYFSQSVIPPVMDIHHLQTDKEAYFSQSVIAPMMDVRHIQTDKDMPRSQTDEKAPLSESSIPPLWTWELPRSQTDEKAHLSESSIPPMKDMPRSESFVADLSESSIPPPMELHRLTTDEEAHFPSYVGSPTCNSSIPYPMTMSPTMTSPFHQYATSPAYHPNVPSSMTVSPTMTISSSPFPSSPKEDADMVLSLSSLLQSPGGNTLATAADTNPPSLSESHATFSGITEPIPSAQPMSPSTTRHANAYAGGKSAEPSAAQRLAVVKAQLQAIRGLPGAAPEVAKLEVMAQTLEQEHRAANKTDSTAAPTIRPTVPSGVNELASQPQAKGSPQAKKKKKLSKGCGKGAPLPNDGPTTLMIRGIPCGISQEELMALMDNAGLKGKYDFFYLPTDRERNGNKIVNLGYAFVNFGDQQSAEYCTSTFRDVRLAPSRSLKKCDISPADIQGIASLKKHFQSTAVSHGARGPMFLKLCET